MRVFSRIQKTDIQVLNWTYTHVRTRIGNFVMPFLSISGNFGFVWFFITAYLFFSKISKEAAYATFWSLFFSAFFGNLILKNVVRRPRPFTVVKGYDTIIDHPVDFSFPSGHTWSSFAAATSLCYFLPGLGVFAVILACAIAFSRLYLCVHYLSDVIFSVFLGIGTAICVQYLISMNLLR